LSEKVEFLRFEVAHVEVNHRIEIHVEVNHRAIGTFGECSFSDRICHANTAELSSPRPNTVLHHKQKKLWEFGDSKPSSTMEEMRVQLDDPPPFMTSIRSLDMTVKWSRPIEQD
jgi:hypothetical protein